MKNSVVIKSIEISHPENKVSNEPYIEHFKKQGRDITGFLKIMGKEERFIIKDDAENTLTMGIESSKKALASAGLKGSDIDMVVFSTQVPEYLTPTNAVKVHEAIQGSKDAVVLDSNANCSGMVLAVEQASVYMLGNKHIKRALVVGSDHLSLMADPEQEIAYGMFGDASCSVVLEKIESDEETGFIDAKYHTYTGYIDKIHYPASGISKSAMLGKIDKLNFEQFPASFGTPIIYELIETLLERNNLSVKDVDAFCLSQFAFGDTMKIQEHFNISGEKLHYVGDKYGYTGTTSPFMALNEGVKNGKIKRGDTVLFWTVGAGHQFVAMLFKY